MSVYRFQMFVPPRCLHILSLLIIKHHKSPTLIQRQKAASKHPPYEVLCKQPSHIFKPKKGLSLFSFDNAKMLPNGLFPYFCHISIVQYTSRVYRFSAPFLPLVVPWSMLGFFLILIKH
nr:MAG TPA_asm: hypothetical protein [Caudoviricetes sp.]